MDSQLAEVVNAGVTDCHRTIGNAKAFLEINDCMSWAMSAYASRRVQDQYNTHVEHSDTSEHPFGKR